jgi:hypothetical protein
MSPLNSNTIGTLETAVSLFRDHEGVNLNKMEKWSAQFGQQNQQLVLKILSNIGYYSGPTIRQMVEKLIELVCTHLQLSDRKKILFVPIGEPYEGSAVIARALRDSRGIQPKQIKHQRDLAVTPKERNIRAIVFLDVFSGTGNQICDWWTNMETLLLPLAHKSIKLILGILAMNYKAKETLKSIPADKINVSYLDIRHNILSEKSKVFFDSEKKLIRKFCRETNCSREYLYGKGECGLLIAFKHGCPNNSLPILWYESDRWMKIFRRRAL